MRIRNDSARVLDDGTGDFGSEMAHGGARVPYGTRKPGAASRARTRDQKRKSPASSPLSSCREYVEKGSYLTTVCRKESNMLRATRIIALSLLAASLLPQAADAATKDSLRADMRKLW